MNQKKIAEIAFSIANEKRFEDLLNQDLKDFKTKVDNGLGWIEKEEILDTFLRMHPKWETPLIDKNVLKKKVESFLPANMIKSLLSD